MNEQTASQIYNILIEECGAQQDGREAFVQRQTDDHYPFEYRFCGALGFGGKFRRSSSRWYVTCYSEDKTPERAAMIETANQRLEKLRQEANKE